jgi:hypothetical protein
MRISDPADRPECVFTIEFGSSGLAPPLGTGMRSHGTWLRPPSGPFDRIAGRENARIERHVPRTPTPTTRTPNPDTDNVNPEPRHREPRTPNPDTANREPRHREPRISNRDREPRHREPRISNREPRTAGHREPRAAGPRTP